jgi:hypothetical protein
MLALALERSTTNALQSISRFPSFEEEEKEF